MSSLASSLIKAEIGRLKARKAYLESGFPEHQKQIELQKQRSSHSVIKFRRSPTLSTS